MDAAAGERGGAPQEEPLDRRAVRRQRRDRPQDELPEPVAAAADVAADEVAVARLEIGGAEDVAGENEVAEAGGVALDLGLDARDVASCSAPQSIPRPGACVYAQAVCLPAGARVGSERLLAEQQERALGQSFGRRGERGEQLGLAAADVDGAGGAQLLGRPGDRPSSAQSTLSVAGP